MTDQFLAYTLIALMSFIGIIGLVYLIAFFVAAFYVYRLNKLAAACYPTEEEALEAYKVKAEKHRIEQLSNQGIEADLHDVTKI